eukprot:TRINITY_DN31906_c0_g1_i1.p1 TRINITY_DN31906_c0_g1~~TRINITY_DN31906_c0_g1_i1.p1  ORF type:complete len:271 (-),score=46.34 TRINITY_DN31906_c0_g1_i1:606-1301(-)
MKRRCGSLEYVAPEVFAERPYGLPVDMFAFGVTLYYALGKEFLLATPGMTYEAAAAKSRRYRISFGSNFDHVGNDAIKLISWLVHPCDTWRPDAAFASECPPFASPQLDKAHEVLSFEKQLHSRVAADDSPQPPVQRREGLARPTPLRQFKDVPDTIVLTSDTAAAVYAAEVEGSQDRKLSQVESKPHSSQVSDELRVEFFAEQLRRKLFDELRTSCILDATFMNNSSLQA